MALERSIKNAMILEHYKTIDYQNSFAEFNASRVPVCPLCPVEKRCPVCKHRAILKDQDVCTECFDTMVARRKSKPRDQKPKPKVGERKVKFDG